MSLADSRQPTLPFARGSDTSRAAAKSIAPILTEQEAQVFALFVEAGERGLTTDEAEVLSGKRHQSVSARVNGLTRKGHLVCTEATRPTRSNRKAHVYRARVP